MYKIYPIHVKRIIKLYQYNKYQCYKLLLIQIINYHLNKVYYENTHYIEKTCRIIIIQTGKKE